jgi:hypothetical protein
MDLISIKPVEWEHQDFQDAVEGIWQGYEDVRAGRNSLGRGGVARKAWPSELRPSPRQKRDLDAILARGC